MLFCSNCITRREGRQTSQWVSCQIRKIAGCACSGNAGIGFPATGSKENRFLAIPTCITTRASRTCRDACHDRYPAVAEETFPAFRAQALPAILRTWQEAHAQTSSKHCLIFFSRLQIYTWEYGCILRRGSSSYGPFL